MISIHTGKKALRQKQRSFETTVSHSVDNNPLKNTQGITLHHEL